MKHETTIIPSIKNCARCGKNHVHVKATRFIRPIGDATFWASCPSTGDPILLAIFSGGTVEELEKFKEGLAASAKPYSVDPKNEVSLEGSMHNLANREAFDLSLPPLKDE